MLVLFLTVSACAKDKVFVVVSSVYVASVIVDTEVSLVTIQRDLQFHEYNFIFGSRPTRQEFYAKGGPLVVGVVYISYQLRKAGKWWWFIPMTIMTGIHTYLAMNEGRW